MRCNKCGYDNAEGSTSCLKCGSPLTSGPAGYANTTREGGSPYSGSNWANRQQRYTPAEGAVPRPTVAHGFSAEPAPRPTIVGGYGGAPVPRPTVKGVGTGWTDGQEAYGGTPQQLSCPYCHRPLQPGTSSCPGCGAPLLQPQRKPRDAKPQSLTKHNPQTDSQLLAELPQEVECVKCGQMVTAASNYCPQCGERVHLPTIKVKRHKAQPRCRLTPIAEEGENLTDEMAREYEGTEVVLTRENTEPANRTITSKEQAVMACENGKWYIENKSEMHSTYIEVNRRIELQPGDIILLGDRRFRFSS